MADTIPLNGEAPTGARPPRGEAPPRPRAKSRAAAKPRATAADDTVKRTPADRKLAASIAEMYQMLGIVGMGIGQTKNDGGVMATSAAFAENGEAIAEAWMDLGDKNPRIKAMLKSLTEVSAVGAVVGLHVTCLLPLLSDRGIVPPILAGMQGPSNSNGA